MADVEETGSKKVQFTAPLWINAELIQKALRAGGEEQIEVAEVAVVPATASGDNYASTICRVRATLADGTQRSLVVKAPPRGEIFSEWARQWGIFRREGLLLGEVIPKMEALLEDAAPGKYPPFAARCPLWGDAPEDFVVVEDLRVANFTLADRQRGLGLRHSLLALRALARFHAASHALLRRQPELREALPVLWRITNEAVVNFAETGVQAAADACRSWPGFEKYADILDKYKSVCLQTVTDLPVPKPGAFHVIAHGDFWVNNMMVRYEEGFPQDHRVVDLQLAAVSSPSIDLHYFLSTSISENVSIHYEDLLLREYYFTLADTLDILGVEPPSYELLMADFDAHGAYALWGSLNIIPIVKAERTPDLEDAAAGNANSIAYLYKSPFVKRWMQRVLPLYVARGWVPTGAPRLNGSAANGDGARATDESADL